MKNPFIIFPNYNGAPVLIAVDKITTLLPRAFHLSANGLDSGVADVLAELYEQIHRALVYLGSAYDECHGMQTTMSLGWFTPERMYFSHVGDSRIYHLPKGENEIKQLTDDDTHVGWLFRTGQINDREARTHPRRNVLGQELQQQFRHQPASPASQPSQQALARARTRPI